MADSKSRSPTPSTSGTKMAENDKKRKTPPTLNDEEEFTLRSLNIIAKIAAVLKTDNKGFVAFLEKVLTLVDGADTEKRKLTYNLVENTISNILEADEDELLSAKGYFENIFSQRKFKDILIFERNLTRLAPLDEGGFSYVLLGELSQNGSKDKVAIKRSKSFQYNHIIEHEVSVLSKLKHKNVLKMLGKHESEPEIILEFMDLGNLVSAVEKVCFTKENLLRFLDDVASGMEFLTEKKYLHRDLACRNVFLNKKKQCKIGDFGFAVYVGDSNGVYVEKVFNPHDFNMSPETFHSKIFTTPNDVWAMGLLCWELFYITEHCEEIPPSMFTKKEHQALFQIQKIQLPKSKICPDNLHRYVVNNLLNQDPKQRPTFTAIRAKIKGIATNM